MAPAASLSGVEEQQGFTNLLTHTRSELDLLDPHGVDAFVEREHPQHVILAAAKVGGILANATYPADFLYQNLMIAAIELCDAYRTQHGHSFISAMPTNLYGPGDNFDQQTSHVLTALIRKAVEAKDSGAPSLTVWGTGTPKREFLLLNDLADACLFLLEHVDEPAPINVGTGEDVTIRELAELVCRTVGYEGELVFDASKPDGTPRRPSAARVERRACGPPSASRQPSVCVTRVPPDG